MLKLVTVLVQIRGPVNFAQVPRRQKKNWQIEISRWQNGVKKVYKCHAHGGERENIVFNGEKMISVQ